MIMYHGTASTYLPSIEAYGLKPQPSKNFKVINTEDYGVIPKTEHAVYLTTSRNTAEKFARLRASYLTAQPGHLVAEYPKDIFVGRTQLVYYKSPHGPKAIAGAKPVIIEVNVPQNIATKLNDDEDAPSMEAFWYPGIIPPSAIVKVDTL